MAGQQTDDEIQELLSRLRGQEIAGLQVLGLNSLKSLTPPLEVLIGQSVIDVAVSDRILNMETSTISVRVDLQRVGKLVWRATAEPFKLAPGVPMPTVRLLLRSGSALDLTEPNKTKRITVTLSQRP